MKIKLSATKEVQISKNQSEVLIITAVAVIITVFCLVSAKALLAEASFQRHVINAQNSDATQLQTNVQTAQNLVSQYNSVFENNNPVNVLGGANDSSTSAIPPNIDNGRIVLDALPTSYDFPALLTSISNLLAEDSLGTPSIGGTDLSQTVSSAPSSNPKVTPINVTISGTGTYQAVQNFIKDLERSIRPFNVTKLSLQGSESNMSVSLSATTYYQPSKTLDLNTQEIH